MSFVPMPVPLTTTVIPPGGAAFRRFSRNGLLTTTPATVDTAATHSLSLRTSAAAIQVSSTSAADTLLGTGARAIKVTGLAADWTPYTETIELNGTSVVTSAGTFIRVTSAELSASGTYAGLPGVTPPTGANIGVINVSYADDATVILSMPIQSGREFASCFTVPKGYYMGIDLIATTVSANKTCDLDIYARRGANIVVAPFYPSVLSSALFGLTGAISSVYASAILIPEYTDVYCLAATASGSGDISLTIGGYLVPNPA